MLSFFLSFFVRVNGWAENYFNIFSSHGSHPYLQRLLENKRKRKDILEALQVVLLCSHDWFNLTITEGEELAVLEFISAWSASPLHPQ